MNDDAKTRLYHLRTRCSVGLYGCLACASAYIASGKPWWSIVWLVAALANLALDHSIARKLDKA